MQVKCVANIKTEVRQGTSYTNGVEVFPDPGTLFSFRSADGQFVADGVYEVEGNLTKLSGVSNKSGSAKQYDITTVTGSAKAVKMSFAPLK